MSTLTKLIILGIAELYFTNKVELSGWLIVAYGIYKLYKDGELL